LSHFNSEALAQAAQQLERSPSAAFPNLHMSNEELALKLYAVEQELAELRREIAEWKTVKK
jgi:hypothetical protein